MSLIVSFAGREGYQIHSVFQGGRKAVCCEDGCYGHATPTLAWEAHASRLLDDAKVLGTKYPVCVVCEELAPLEIELQTSPLRVRIPVCSKHNDTTRITILNEAVKQLRHGGI